MRRIGLVASLALSLLPSTLAFGDTVPLPTPEAARVQQAKLIAAVGGRPDRLLSSDVPGPVVNDEIVRVGLAADGSVQAVTADQRLRLTGQGDYAIRERGPARSATSLSLEPPPITRRGAVVWQGFSPGRRDLAARLTLDAQLEATRLPLSVAISFTSASGRQTSLGAGGVVLEAGQLTVTITNTTEQPAELPTGADLTPAGLGSVVAALDRALAVSRRPSAARLPSAGAGLPASLAVTHAAAVTSVQAVPWALTGSMTLAGAPLRGPAMAPDGRFRGTLGGSLAGQTRASVTFTAQASGPGRLALDLTAVSAFNVHELAPPGGFASWAAWGASRPSAAARAKALSLLIALAATGARASSYAPYLGADLVGSGSTTFRYALAPAQRLAPAIAAVHPRWLPLSVAGLALLLMVALGVVVWRRN